MAITLDGSNGITTDIASNESATFNRDTNDGDLIILQKDNSTVGSIQSDGGRIKVISEGQLLLRQKNTTTRNMTFDSSYFGTDNGGDNTVDLGRSAGRFKDLYLSGGVYLGGTGSANYLDDYEEGTWTPTLGGTATYNDQEGHYIKVGGLVYITCRINVNNIGTGSANRIQGLPFTSAEEGALSSEYLSGLAVTTSFITFRTAGDSIYAFYASTATWSTLSGNPDYLQNGTAVEVAGCYKTLA